MTDAVRFYTSRRRFLDSLAGGLALAALVRPNGAMAQPSSLSSMTIATIGAGREGGSLGTLYAKLGSSGDVFLPASRNSQGSGCRGRPHCSHRYHRRSRCFRGCYFSCRALHRGRTDWAGVRNSPRCQAACPRRLQPNSGPRRPGFRESGSRRRRAGGGLGKVAERRQDRAGIQCAQLCIRWRSLRISPASGLGFPLRATMPRRLTLRAG